MVLEVALISVKPGEEEAFEEAFRAGRDVLASTPGCLSVRMTRGVESPSKAVLLVECPRLLFPFARNILADVTRDGGFPPVLLSPIDFVALWQNRRQGGQQMAQA